MAIWYVRPVSSGSGLDMGMDADDMDVGMDFTSAPSYGDEDGTSYPNAWNGLASIVWGVGGVVAGDTLYYAGTFTGEQMTATASGTSGNAITIRGDYPGDPGIIDGGGTSNYCIYAIAEIYITLLNGTVKNSKFYAINFDNGAGTDTVSRNIVIDNMTVTEVNGGAASAIGIRGSGKDVEIKNCTITDIDADGIWWRGSAHIHDNDISQVSQGTTEGDAIQFSEDGTSLIVEDNTIDHSDTDYKYCIVLGGTGTDGIIRRNTLTGYPSGATNACLRINAMTGCEVYRNYCTGGRYGIQDISSGNLYYSNIVLNATQRGFTLGSGSANCQVINNVVSGGERGIMSESTAQNNDIRANIIAATTVYGIDKEAGDIEDYNCIYKSSGNDSTHALGDDSLTVDPALDAQYRPTNPDLVGAGIAVVGVTTDYDGNTYSDPPTIGAFEMEWLLSNYQHTGFLQNVGHMIG